MVKQLTFDHSGPPLSSVEFVVIDCETTGLGPETDSITEIAAVKICGGEIISSLRTFVNPHCTITPRIAALTGITDNDVADAPSIENVLPSLLEFIGNATLVGHNVRFDIAFINAALTRHDYPPLPQRSLDTLSLARALIPGETRNFKLSTLAQHAHASHSPTHRALDDVLATVDLFHYLIERSSSVGVQGLGDLFSLPHPIRRQRQTKKHMAADAPSSPGIYMFMSRDDELLYVGTSRNIARRLQTYFTRDDRKNISRMFKHAHHIEYITTPRVCDARVAELRILQGLYPRFNIADRTIRRMHYVCADPDELAPTFRVASKPQGIWFGPFSSAQHAQHFRAALLSAFNLRTCDKICTSKPPSPSSACINSLRGVHSCFCSGDWSSHDNYMNRFHQIDSFEENYPVVVAGLLSRMKAFSDELRFEKAHIAFEQASCLQKWMNRFSMMNQARHFSHPETEISPCTIQGRAFITFSPCSHKQSSEPITILHDENERVRSASLKTSDDFFPAKEYIERYYTACFLTRNNLLMTELNIPMHATVATDHNRTNATTIL